MLIPIAVIIVFSFNDPAGTLQLHLGRASRSSTGRTPFAIPELNDALLTSLELAALATADLDRSLGTLIALALVRYEFFGRRAANFLIVIPMATPEVVIGAALLSMFLIYGDRARLHHAADRPRDVLRSASSSSSCARG